MVNKKNRCSWCNIDNSLYVKYHDEEWGVLNTSDKYLFEMLVLESFQAGLSWETILNKREYFKDAYDNFDIKKVLKFDDKKKESLLKNKNIIRNKLKIDSSIRNALIFNNLIIEFGSFYNYLKQFTKGQTFIETGKTSSFLSDEISKDLKKRGMKFVGTTIIYSFLQAVGIIYSHEEGCYLYEKKRN